MITRSLAFGWPAIHPFQPGAKPAPMEEPELPPRTFPLAETEDVAATIRAAKIESLRALASEGFDGARLDAVDLAKVGVGPIDFEPILLCASAARALVERKIALLQKTLFGVEPKHSAFASIYRDYLIGRERGELIRSQALIEYHRLVERTPDDFIAALDPSTGRIALIERIVPQTIPIHTRDGASKGIAIGGLSASQQSYLRSALEMVMPEGVLDVLARSGTVLSFVDQPGAVSPTALARFGESCTIDDLTCPGLGRYWAFLGEAMIPLAPETTVSMEALLSIVVHELAHALDWALGEPGKRWSDSEEWRSLFAATEVFPTERSAQDPAEFFAECAAIYLLGRHVETQPLKDLVTTRSDLIFTAEPAYRCLEQLFGRSHEGRRISPETQRIEVERALARATGDDVAVWRHILSEMTK